MQTKCRGAAKFLFASSQKCDSPFRGVARVEISATLCRRAVCGVLKQCAERCADIAVMSRRPTTGRRGLHGWWVAVRLWVWPFFYIQFSSFKQGAGSAFLCDQNLSSCSPNSRPQNVSSYTATLQDIRFEIISFRSTSHLMIPLYLSRKRGGLLHKKCNNCRNVAKLNQKSFVCTNFDMQNCAVSPIRQKRFIFYCPGNNICGGDKK